MLHFEATEMGPRHVSTAWNLHKMQTGQWSLSETRFYEKGTQMYQMPQAPTICNTLNDALATVPTDARPIDKRSGVPITWTSQAA